MARPLAAFIPNLKSASVSLLPEKTRSRHLRKLDKILSAKAVTRKDVVSLHGSLQHDTAAYPGGRFCLPRLSSFILGFPNDYIQHDVPESIRLDLHWWKQVLSRQRQRQRLEPGIWIDAATNWGLGFVIGPRWAAWRLLPGWKCDGREIMWAELIALELAALSIKATGMHDADVVINCDNTGVIDTIKKGKSSNGPRNASVRRIMDILSPQNLTISPVYVPSASNLADPISRGKLGAPSARVHSEFRIPVELRPFLGEVK